MSKVKDGGPAFPHEVMQFQMGCAGMSLRDYFAAKAMPIVHGSCGRYGPEGLEMVCKQAYAVADAMLAEREKRNVA